MSVKIKRVGGAQAKMALKDLRLIKVDMASAERLFNADVPFVIAPSKVNSFHFFKGWSLAIHIDPVQYKTENWTFKQFLNNWSYHNENSETGKAAFFMKARPSGPRMLFNAGGRIKWVGQKAWGYKGFAGRYRISIEWNERAQGYHWKVRGDDQPPYTNDISSGWVRTIKMAKSKAEEALLLIEKKKPRMLFNADSGKWRSVGDEVHMSLHGYVARVRKYKGVHNNYWFIFRDGDKSTAVSEALDAGKADTFQGAKAAAKNRLRSLGPRPRMLFNKVRR